MSNSNPASGYEAGFLFLREWGGSIFISFTYLEFIDFVDSGKKSKGLGASQAGPETTIYHKWRPKWIVSMHLKLTDI